MRVVCGRRGFWREGQVRRRPLLTMAFTRPSGSPQPTAFVGSNPTRRAVRVGYPRQVHPAFGQGTPEVSLRAGRSPALLRPTVAEHLCDGRSGLPVEAVFELDVEGRTVQPVGRHLVPIEELRDRWLQTEAGQVRRNR